MRTGKPSYRARLMKKKASAVSLSRLRAMRAERSSRSSSRSRARYHDGGDWRGRERTACHLSRRRWASESRPGWVGRRIVCRGLWRAAEMFVGVGVGVDVAGVMLRTMSRASWSARIQDRAGGT